MDYEQITKKQLEEELKKAQAKLAEFEKYELVRKAAGEMKAMQMAFVDAGFTEDQAFQLIISSLPLAAKMS